MNIAKGLKIGLKTKLALGPQFGRIDKNKYVGNPTFA